MCRETQTIERIDEVIHGHGRAVFTNTDDHKSSYADVTITSASKESNRAILGVVQNLEDEGFDVVRLKTGTIMVSFTGETGLAFQVIFRPFKED